ncbi:MAG: AAA family ATPase [Planctomycetes bacterium]|nr:AAA family ATPase [Planctomycetota bacterium]
MSATGPVVVLIAGPDGAGKSTAAPRLLRDAFAVDEFVNADAIARGLSAFRPETVSFAAGRAMMERMRTLARERKSFAFETTLASRTFAPWLGRMRRSGYAAHLVFLSLPSEELALARVAARVRDGGHDVPEEVVRRRYKAGLRNLITLYSRAVDSWRVHDNSVPDRPRPIASGGSGIPTRVIHPSAWRDILEHAG